MTLHEHKTAERRRIRRKQSSPTEAERLRQQRERERERARLAREAVALHRDRVLTFRQWCAVNNFSLATGRRILKGEKGPKPPIVQLSPRRIGIRESDNAAWQVSRAR